MLRSVACLSRSAVRGLTTSSRAFVEQPSKNDIEDLFKEKSERKHAFSKNRVEIVGGVAADPILKTGKNGRSFTIFNVITNSQYRTPDGEYKDQNERHSITVFGNRAETLVNTIKKGTRVMVEGKLHYTGGMLGDDGQRSPRQTHIHADSIQPLARNERSE